MSHWRAFTKSAAAILIALALVPAAAHADVATAVDGGDVHLGLTAALSRAFKREGVRLVGLGPAKAGGAGVTLPISDGLLESQYGSGYLFLSGGFGLRAGKRAVAVKSLVLDINGHALRGKVDGTAMKLAEPAPQQVGFDGFDLDLSLASLKLTGRAASVLNRKLRLHGVFKAGRSLASVAALAEFELLTVRGGEITFTVDQSFEEKLATVEAVVVSYEAAKVVGAAPTVISMPVWGGRISPDLSLGTLLSEGGCEFLQHDEPFDHKVAFLDTNVAFESKLVSGTANVETDPQHGSYSGLLGILPADFAGQANPETGEIGATSLPVVLHPELAALMNEVFGAPKGRPEFFAGGETIGSLSFRAQTR